jgi:MoxR-like ATPase
MTGDWKIFRGDTQEPHNGVDDLPDPPNWRKFNYDPTSKNFSTDNQYREQLLSLASQNQRDQERGQRFYIRTEPTSQEAYQHERERVVDAVNAALYLRRPLLVTGQPGSGKTSLAYAVAYQLRLGPVLLWPITVRSTLKEGLYQYDAIARLQDAQLSSRRITENEESPNIGEYLRLGPLGTAFLSSNYPRVLLIDEIDKADLNLPNDLLNLFEEGQYEVPELVRLARQVSDVEVLTEDGLTTTIHNGKVQCNEFPLVILTSNGERDFPPAFLRRCIRVRMPSPSIEDLRRIVQVHLEQSSLSEEILALIQEFADRRDNNEESLATDQLLNTVYLLSFTADYAKLKDLLFKSLSSAEEYA